MDHKDVHAAAYRSIGIDDLNGLTVHEEDGKFFLTDEEGRRWTLMIVQVLPDPDHTVEECPHRIDTPDRVIPAAVFHGPKCMENR